MTVIVVTDDTLISRNRDSDARPVHVEITDSGVTAFRNGSPVVLAAADEEQVRQAASLIGQTFARA